jgi:hypothetical protein
LHGKASLASERVALRVGECGYSDDAVSTTTGINRSIFLSGADGSTSFSFKKDRHEATVRFPGWLAAGMP